MNKSSLINALARDQGISIPKAEEVVNTVFSEMTDALVHGDRIEIRGFGSFKVKEYDPYQGRNPNTGESVNVAGKKLPAFKVGKDLKRRVDILIKEPPKPERPPKKTPSTRVGKTKKTSTIKLKKKSS